MYRDGVTIAIPNWNHEFFLPRSLRSALDAVRVLRDQGVGGEVLVIDDTSRDGSRALLRSLEAIYSGRGLRVHAHEKNAGLSAARNTALLEARYRYIFFMDADNEILGENLPLFLQAIRETSAAAAYGNLLIRKLGHDRAWRICSNESFQSRLYAMNFIDACALFDRTQILDLEGYFVGMPAWEDWEMWMHLATNGREIAFVPLALGYYYDLPDSMVRTIPDPSALLSRFRRVYNQVGFRDFSRARSSHLRYFPGVGHL